MAPSPPVLTPCPTGWRERAIPGGATACEPWAEDRAPTCADTELALPGRGCEAVDVCPGDGWPTDLPATGVSYVRPGATGGDGTRDAPFGTIADGLRGRGASAVVALSVGEHLVSNLVVTNATIRGACATGTTVRDPSSATGVAAINVAGTVVISGVRLVSGYRGLWVSRTATAMARSVILEGPDAGLRLDTGATFEGDRVRIVATSERSIAPGAPFAVSLRPNSRLTLRHATAMGGARAVIGTYTLSGDPSPGGASVTVEDSAILDGLEGITGPISTVVVRRVAFERLQLAVLVFRGATASLTEVRARELRSLPIAPGAPTGLVSVIGEATLERVTVSDFDRSAVWVLRDGVTTARDVIVERMRPSPDTSDSPFALLANDGQLAVSRVYLGELEGAALGADEGGKLDAADVRVQRLSGANRPGALVTCRLAATCSLTRVAADELTTVTAIAGSGGRLSITDGEFTGGRGLAAQCAPEANDGCEPGFSSELALTRVRVRAALGLGVVFTRANGTLADLDVQGVLAQPEGGYGLFVQGVVSAERVRIRDTVRQAIAGAEGTTTLDVKDLEIDTIASAGTGGLETSGGDGIGCVLGARVAVERATVRGAARAALLAADLCGSVTLRDTVRRENSIGVLTDETNVVPELERVVLRDNTTDFNAFSVTVEPPPPLTN